MVIRVDGVRKWIRVKASSGTRVETAERDDADTLARLSCWRQARNRPDEMAAVLVQLICFRATMHARTIDRPPARFRSIETFSGPPSATAHDVP